MRLPWAQRGATLAVFFAHGLGTGAWAGAVAPLQQQMDLTPASLSLALLTMAAGAFSAMPAMGHVVGALGGSGRALRFLAIAYAGLFALLGVAPNLALLCFATFAAGVFGAATDITINAHATWIEGRWGGAIMSSFHAAWSGGGLAGAALAGVLLHDGFGTAALLALFGALLAAVFCASFPFLGAGEAHVAQDRVFALPNRRHLGVAGVALLCLLVEGAMSDWSAIYLQTVTGLAADAATSGYAAFAFAMLTARALGDGIVRLAGRWRVIAFGGLVAAAGLALCVAAAHSQVAILAGLAIIGLGLSNVVPAVFSQSAALGPNPALGIAMTSSFGYVGLLIGPPIIGAIATASSLRVSFAVLVLAMLAIPFLAARDEE